MAHNLVGQQFSGSNPVPQGAHYPAFGESGGSFSPYGAFAASDGWVMLVFLTIESSAACALLLTVSIGLDDPRFSTNIQRVNHRAELNASAAGTPSVKKRRRIGTFSSIPTMYLYRRYKTQHRS